MTRSNAAKRVEETPAPARTFGNGKFTFAVTKVEAIPLEATQRTAPRSQELWFKDWFDAAEHHDHIFIPDSFWTSPKADGGRGVPAEKLSVGYVRNKVRDQFNAWVKRGEPAEDAPRNAVNLREGFQVLMVPRKEGEKISEASAPFPESGISVFWVDKSR